MDAIAENPLNAIEKMTDVGFGPWFVWNRLTIKLGRSAIENLRALGLHVESYHRRTVVRDLSDSRKWHSQMRMQRSSLSAKATIIIQMRQLFLFGPELGYLLDVE
jgi:hypothetical protein